MCIEHIRPNSLNASLISLTRNLQRKKGFRAVRCQSETFHVPFSSVVRCSSILLSSFTFLGRFVRIDTSFWIGSTAHVREIQLTIRTQRQRTENERSFSMDKKKASRTDFRSFEDDDDDGPICAWLPAPPVAIVSGAAFSCERSVRVCCRRLNSFSLSVVNCEWLAEDDVCIAGGLFSMSVFTLSRDSVLSSGWASFEDVEDDAEGGLASEMNRSERERGRSRIRVESLQIE